MTSRKEIQMVDLLGQYKSIKNEVDTAILEVVESTKFIKGPALARFEQNLAAYQGVKYAIGCANGTDALQISLMALGLKPNDEVIVPAFTYVASAEVIGLLGLKPVMIDVDNDTFNTTAELVKAAITPKTKAIMPVHLYGQSCDMEGIMKVANEHRLFVIEDNAQALGADYHFKDGTQKKTGTIGHIGCTSFFPSKNLGCYGDGGAIFTDDDQLAAKLRMVANHGQARKYHHSILGVNSRLDAIQAAILDVKLKYLDNYSRARQEVAKSYNKAFEGIPSIQTPKPQPNSTHVYHQYTLQIKNGERDTLQQFLKEKGIPSVVYYPIPLYQQDAFKQFHSGIELPVTKSLCQSVLSLPIHTEMKEDTLHYIISGVEDFFKSKLTTNGQR